MLTIAKVIQSKHTIKPLSTLTSILPSPRTMTIYSSYLCAALGRESSLVPIHGTDDSVQHGSNSFGGNSEIESNWIEVIRKSKKQAQEKL